MAHREVMCSSGVQSNSGSGNPNAEFLTEERGHFGGRGMRPKARQEGW